MTIIMYYIISR